MPVTSHCGCCKAECTRYAALRSMDGANQNVPLVLHCTVDGITQIVPVAMQCIMDHMSGVNHNVPVTCYCGWYESDCTRCSAMHYESFEWYEPECTRYIASRVA